MPMTGPSCVTHLSCLEQASLDVVPDVLSVSIRYTCRCTYMLVDFVCVEVLRPSQPNGVISNMVSLPDLTFTGQA